MENKCVRCGADIPEGRMICPNCESATIKAYEALQKEYEGRAKRLAEMQGKEAKPKNEITVQINTAGFGVAIKEVRALKKELRDIKKLAKALGLKKRDIRKLIAVKVKEGQENERREANRCIR